MPQTIVRVRRDGSIEVEGEGYTGDACLRDLEELLKALKKMGVWTGVVSQRRKAEARVSTSR